MKGAAVRTRWALSKERGVTLVELLVVVVLIGIVAFIGATQLGGLLKKEKLAAAANDARSFLQDVPNQVAKKQMPLFVRFLPASGGLPARLQVTQDSAGTQVLRTFNFPSEIVFDFANVSAINCNWPQVGGVYTLRCDTLNRATDPLLLTQLQGTADLLITHRNMVLASLKPKYGFRLTVAPIWEARTAKVYP